MKIIFDILSFLIAIAIPAIPGVLLWVLLAPSDYWQMFASVILGGVLYAISMTILSRWANR